MLVDLLLPSLKWFLAPPTGILPVPVLVQKLHFEPHDLAKWPAAWWNVAVSQSGGRELLKAVVARENEGSAGDLRTELLRRTNPSS